MVEIKILSVRNPRWANEDGSAIDCLIRTNTLREEVPFTATPYDSEPHGREIYERCRSGEFGEIATMDRRAPAGTLRHLELPLQYQCLMRFLIEANHENGHKSIRGMVIVWAALIDDLLNALLKGEATRLEAAGRSIGRPPTTFNGRIIRAKTLNLISSEEEERCHHVRRIRNTVAHEWDLSLASKDILQSLRALYELDHANLLVYHEDLYFLIQQVYGGSCGILTMKFMKTVETVGKGQENGVKP